MIGQFPYGGNASLTSLSGLDSLVFIGDNLTIGGNDILTSLQELNNLTFIGSLSIYDNPSLTSFAGFENLTSIVGEVGISNNESLTSLTGMDNITFIGSDLEITSNETLSSLTGLVSLSSIGGNLVIMDNEVITSLSGLENIDWESIVGLNISGNDSLSDCDLWNICQYLNYSGGTMVIEYNATECNSIDEVQEHCLTNIEENPPIEEFNIYPNPLGSTVTFTYTLKQSSFVTLKILDLSGREISIIINEVQKQGEQKVIYNSHGLKPGIYFCILKTTEGIETRKMIKVE
jgi:hypothetical protein